MAWAGVLLLAALAITPRADAQAPPVRRAPYRAADSLAALAARLDSILRADSLAHRADSLAHRNATANWNSHADSILRGLSWVADTLAPRNAIAMRDSLAPRDSLAMRGALANRDSLTTHDGLALGSGFAHGLVGTSDGAFGRPTLAVDTSARWANDVPPVDTSGGAAGTSSPVDSAVPPRWELAAEEGNPLAGIPRTHADSAASKATHLAAERDHGYRLVISLGDRRLWVVQGDDTLLSAPVAIGAETTLAFGGSTWEFGTPRGMRRVLDKTVRPAWIPPVWHYAEVAREYGLALDTLERGVPRWLSDGRRLEVRDSAVGVVSADSGFIPLRTDEEIVFDNTIFVPPIGTVNRRIEGELGMYSLDLGNGYLLHGTPDAASIGRARTHGCIRLHDEDIAWLYEHVPVGARVYIY
ncbi:MAG TPA: L,D-transpeptidase [Gemmatimonadaceae bacterium]|nr:L,D-transpeptidase [Gemmatimonadaceae bacterium]